MSETQENSGTGKEPLYEELFRRLDPEDFSEEDLLALLEEAFNILSGDEGYLDMIRTAVPGVEISYGIRVPQLRSLTQDLVRRCRSERGHLMEMIEPIWKQSSREHKLVALFTAFYGKIPPDRGWDLARKMIPDIQNWEECDQLCLSLTKPALTRDPSLYDTLEQWIQGDNFWRRRAALVTAAIVRKPAVDAAAAKDLDRRTLQMCLLMINDREPYIAKAVDWTIREVLKRRYDLGRSWMFGRLDGELLRTARSTLRKASVKLTPADREMFLEGLG